MMLASTSRSTGACLVDTDHVDHVELFGRKAGEDTAQTGGEPSPHHQRPTDPATGLVEGEELLAFDRIVGEGHHVATGGEHRRRQLRVRPDRTGEQHDVDRVRRVRAIGTNVDVTGDRPEGGQNTLEPPLIDIVDAELGDGCTNELAGEV
jgi:hypothetical protein